MPNHSANFDLRCYLVTSGTDRRTVEVAAQAAAAGAGMIQVRAKDITARELLDLAVTTADAVHAANPHTKVVVDDRADVAYAAMRSGAAVHGVHLEKMTCRHAMPVRCSARTRSSE